MRCVCMSVCGSGLQREMLRGEAQGARGVLMEVQLGPGRFVVYGLIYLQLDILCVATAGTVGDLPSFAATAD